MGQDHGTLKGGIPHSVEGLAGEKFQIMFIRTMTKT